MRAADELRVHGPLVHDDEVEAVAQFLRAQGSPEFMMP